MKKYVVMENVEKETADFLVELILFRYGGSSNAKADVLIGAGDTDHPLCTITVHLEEWESDSIRDIIAHTKGAMLVVNLIGGVDKLPSNYRDSDHLSVIKSIQKYIEEEK